MPNQANAELHVLDRLMYLLEEGSVSHLMEQDETFADFISNVYGQLDAQAMALQRGLPAHH